MISEGRELWKVRRDVAFAACAAIALLFAFIGALAIGHKHGVAGLPGVINEPVAVGGPGDLGNVFAQKIVGNSAHQR